MLLTLLLSLLPVSENATDADHAILDTLSGSVLVTSVKQPLRRVKSNKKVNGKLL